MSPVHASSILLADIGGTNSRFAFPNSAGRPENLVVVENDTVPDLESAIDGYLARTGRRPRAAVLAVAAPLDGGDEIALTNRAWRFRRGTLAQQFGWSALRVVNDFEAIAWALTRLRSADLRPLGPELPQRAGVKAVLGPGTGLGVAALIPSGRSFTVLSSEGGHISFGPQSPDEIEVFTRLWSKHGAVSAETILSGPGLVRLMRAVDPATPHTEPEAVVKAALAGDTSAKAAAHLFVGLLGRFAGGLALTFRALGGVTVAGGVASRLGPLLDPQTFRTGFESHPPYENMLRGVPTMLMGRTEPGLLGCAVLADEVATLLA